MRRLFACLMTATLLVALVPSATLAVKPPPTPDAITGITWDVLAHSGLDACFTTVVVDYTTGKGAPRSLYVRLEDVSDPVKTYEPRNVKAERDGQTTFSLESALAANYNWGPLKVVASLVSNKGVILAEEATESYDFSNPCLATETLPDYP